LQLKHQAVDAFREMAAVLDEQLQTGEYELKTATTSQSHLQKYAQQATIISWQLFWSNF